MASGRVDWRVRRPFGDVEIELHPASIDAEAREVSVRELMHLLYDFKYRQPEARRVLREIHARLHGLPPTAALGEAFQFDVGSARAEAFGAELLHEARAGNVVLRRTVTRSVVVPLEVDAEPVLGPEAEPVAWISIELVDEDGNAVPNVDYKVECDDGRVRTGTTNLAGKAREEGLHDGSCKISFPSLNAPDWKKVG
jgi:hypothetical protein